MTVEDCAEVSRCQVGAIMDVEDPITEEYYLEVSSPGLIVHCSRSPSSKIRWPGGGGNASMATNNRRKFKGVIKSRCRGHDHSDGRW